MAKLEPREAFLSIRDVLSRVIRFLGGPFLLGLCLAAFGLVIFGKLASEIFEGETVVFDDWVRSIARQLASPLFTRLMIGVSFVGSPGFLTVIGILAASFFLYRKWRRAFMLFAITMLGEIALNFILKATFQRSRPEAFFGYDVPSSYSFPSGHALGSFCFFGILALLITARLKNPLLVWGIRVAALLLILTIGFSRIYLGVHYTTDVLAGYLAAFVWTSTVALGDSFLRRMELGSKENNSAPPH